MLIFSKLKGGYWPNCDIVSEKCQRIVKDDAEGKDISQYLAGSVPQKDGGYAVVTN
jgi:hypothetical protein